MIRERLRKRFQIGIPPRRYLIVGSFPRPAIGVMECHTTLAVVVVASERLSRLPFQNESSGTKDFAELPMNEFSYQALKVGSIQPDSRSSIRYDE